jgi:hypothetical protein
LPKQVVLGFVLFVEIILLTLPIDSSKTNELERFDKSNADLLSFVEAELSQVVLRNKVVALSRHAFSPASYLRSA